MSTVYRLANGTICETRSGTFRTKVQRVASSMWHVSIGVHGICAPNYDACPRHGRLSPLHQHIVRSSIRKSGWSQSLEQCASSSAHNVGRWEQMLSGRSVGRGIIERSLLRCHESERLLGLAISRTILNYRKKDPHLHDVDLGVSPYTNLQSGFLVHTWYDVEILFPVFCYHTYNKSLSIQSTK
jgi:hypothetical protein